MRDDVKQLKDAAADHWRSVKLRAVGYDYPRASAHAVILSREDGEGSHAGTLLFALPIAQRPQRQREILPSRETVAAEEQRNGRTCAPRSGRH